MEAARTQAGQGQLQGWRRGSDAHVGGERIDDGLRCAPQRRPECSLDDDSDPVHSHPSAPQQQRRPQQQRVRTGIDASNIHAGHGWGTHSLPWERDANAWLAPAWLAGPCHICSSTAAAAVIASQLTALRSSLPPVLLDGTLTWPERSLLRCVRLLQREGMAGGRQRGSAKTRPTGPPQATNCDC